MSEMVFNPKVHICKFGYEFYSESKSTMENWYSILGDLYNKELRIDFWKPQADGSKKIVDAVGFELSNEKMNELLPLLEVERYEKFRDLPSGWEYDSANGGNGGYRDGWGYNFWYMSEYGTPLFQIKMSVLFSAKRLPPYERLLDWLRDNYKENKQLKKWKMFW